MPRAFDLDLERRWRERLREFEQCGLSVRGFCRAHALQEYTFFWWRRELAKRSRLLHAVRSTPHRSPKQRATRRVGRRRRGDDESISRDELTRRVGRRRRGDDEAISRDELTRRGSAFVPVQVITETRGDSFMEFRLGAGLVRVPTSIDEPALRQAIRVLREEAAGC